MLFPKKKCSALLAVVVLLSFAPNGILTQTAKAADELSGHTANGYIRNMKISAMPSFTFASDVADYDIVLADVVTAAQITVDSNESQQLYARFRKADGGTVTGSPETTIAGNAENKSLSIPLIGLGAHSVDKAPLVFYLVIGKEKGLTVEAESADVYKFTLTCFEALSALTVTDG